MALLLDQNKATSNDEALKTFLHYDEDPHHLNRKKPAASCSQDWKALNLEEMRGVGNSKQNAG